MISKIRSMMRLKKLHGIFSDRAYCALTSPHVHAWIRGYRLEAARAIPGVKAILTGPDLKTPRRWHHQG
jgi:CO/xanthine dehydrogenase Mo-binding subunit